MVVPTVIPPDEMNRGKGHLTGQVKRPDA
jgi:hypothetical protein